MHLLTKKYWIAIIFLSLAATMEVSAKKELDLSWEEMVGAKTTPPTENIYFVNDMKLPKNHDLIAVTESIQATIDKCSNKGGGTVAFKPGTYLTGSIYLKDNVNLQIDKDVILLGIQDINYYPEMKSRIAGIEMVWPSALINVLDKKNVAITGEGTVNAQGRYLWEKYWNMRTDYVKKGLRWIVDYDCKRVRTLLVSNSSNVTISDLNFQQSGFWSVHLLYSENVTVDGITIRNNIGGQGPSTDGIDIDSSSKILIQNCDIDCHDDNFCLKAGRDADGLRVNKPTEYVVIRDCVSGIGAGIITIGSETSGSIRNIHAYNLKANGTSTGIKIKSALTRGGTVENIYIHDVELKNVNTALSFGLNWNPSYSYSTLPEAYNIDSVPAHWKTMLTKVEPASKGIPHFKNIVIENITGSNIKTGISAHGMDKSLLEDFTFKNLKIECQKAGSIDYARNWTVENVIFVDRDNNTIELTIDNSKKVKF